MSDNTLPCGCNAPISDELVLEIVPDPASRALAAIADSRACEFRDPLAWAHWCRTIAVEAQAGDAAEVERLIRERR